MRPMITASSRGRRLVSVGLVTAALVAISVATTGAATSTDTAAEVWHKDGPGGAQYVDGYGLTTVLSDKGVWYSSFAPEPGGGSFLAHATDARGENGDDSSAWQHRVVRMRPTAGGRLKPTQVLDFERLRDASLWSDGIAIEDASIGT